MKILLAIDGSPCSDAAVSEVLNRPWPAGSEVKIITAVTPAIYLTPEPWVGAQNYFAEIDKIEHEQAESIIKSAISKLGACEDKSLKISSDVMDGSPKRVIVEEAERWGADLIVLGSHGYGAWNRFLLGSVSQTVSLHAPCSVEIVRCRVAGQENSASESEKK
ncbi:MAG: universal stress protein [Pyrinomonadaceae bacterium]